MIDNGRFAIQISNGQFAYQTDEAGHPQPVIIPNDEHIPGGGLAISYPAGSYHANYARWPSSAKLAFWRCSASSAPRSSRSRRQHGQLRRFPDGRERGYVRLAVDNYSTLGSDDQINFLKLAISFISYGVSWIFNVYADLKPVEKLVNGQMVRA